MNNKILIMLTLLTLLVLSACSVTNHEAPRTVETQELKTFASFAEVQEFLQSSSPQASPVPTMMFAATAELADTTRSTGTTNNQYASVDEADFMKNDNQFIYLIQGNKLVIIDAVDERDIISTTELSESWQQQPQDLFIVDDVLVILMQESREVVTVNKYDILPQTRFQQETVAHFYDVTERSKPTLLTSAAISGNYQQARVHKDVLYLVSQEYTWQGPVIPEPFFRVGDTSLTPRFSIFEEKDSYNFNNILTVDVATQEVVDSEVFLLDFATTLMMSEDALYIASQNQLPWFGAEFEQERFYDVIMPLLEGEIGDEVRNIARLRVAEEERWNRIQEALENYFTEMQALDEENSDALQDYESMMETISEALAEYDAAKQKENFATTIHKITLNDGQLEYAGAGEVPGHLLNQFSMHEHEGNLQVATTLQIWGRDTVQYSNVYVLDESMNTVGAVENIAPDERIYSVRFMGDEAYMVTFREVDPFFVINLKDPNNPFVEGELKLPGYSDYLHPLENNLVIGIGHDTSLNEWGGVSREGVKVALFDVSDKANPRLVDELIFGAQGSSTPVSNDHKAFRYLDGQVILPVREVSEDRSVQDLAYIIDVNEQGLEIAASIEHGRTQSDFYNWRSASTVLRSTYFDSVLYTISSKFVIATERTTFETLANIALPESQGW